MVNKTPTFSDLSSLFDEWRAAPSDWGRINRLVQGISTALENKSMPVESSEHEYRVRSMRALLARIEGAREGNSIDDAIGYAFALGMEAASSTTKLTREETWIHGGVYRDSQSAKGKKGADMRWGNNARQAVEQCIGRLRGSKYQDWNAKEKWDELISIMQDIRLDDGERLDPRESWVRGQADKSKVEYTGDSGKPLTYKTFRNKLSR